MKVQQVHLKKGLDLAALDSLAAMNPSLVLVFGGTCFFEDSQLGIKLKEKFPSSIVVGCSSAGEIANDAAVYDDTLVLTGIADEGSEFFLATARIENSEDSLKAGKDLGAALSQHGVSSVLVLAPGLEVNGSDLADGLAASLGHDVIVTGGLAGDGPRFQRTYTLFNESVTTDVALAVGLKGGSIKVTYGSAGGWEPFGLERKVTRAISNILYELDGKPALQLYKEYLGEKAKELPASGLLYPLSMQKDAASLGDDDPLSGGLIRTILNIDEESGSLILAGDIPEGSLVRLMYAKSDGLVRGAVEASEQAYAYSTEDSFGILISCVGRKLVMGHDVDEEVDAVKATFGDKAVITGFYSYGEICAMGQSNRKPCLHNQTMTVTRMGKSS